MRTGTVLMLGTMIALVTLAVVAQPVTAARVCYVGPTEVAGNPVDHGWATCCGDENDVTTCGYGGLWPGK